MRFATPFAAFLLFAFASGASAADVQWSTYTDQTGTFTLEVPQTPVVTTKSTKTSDGVDVPLVEYMIDRGDIALLAMVGDFNSMNIDPDTALNQAVAGVQADNPTPLDSTPLTIDGHVGRNVTWHDKDGDSFVNRIFFFDHHLYQVIVVTPGTPTDEQRATGTRYSQSLHFLH